MLLPGTTTLISYYTGSSTQAICCVDNSHSSQQLLVHFAGKKLYQLLSKVNAIFFFGVFDPVNPNHFKESFPAAQTHYSHCIFDDCCSCLPVHMIHTNCFPITPIVIKFRKPSQELPQND